MRCVINDAVPAEIVAIHSHMKPVVVPVSYTHLTLPTKRIV